MDQLVDRCAGLDVHKDTVVACVRLGRGAQTKRETRTFSTVTKDLLRLRDWLEKEGVTHVAMESTGVYWRPVWHVLDGAFDMTLANARDVKNVPGRKTDVKDAEWLANLVAHGMMRKSFVPPEPIQDLRDLTRTRKQLSREICQHVQRVQKVLEEANVKMGSFLSDVMGESGRRVINAIVAGTEQPDDLVALISKRVKASREDLVEALRGRVRDHHRFMLRMHLGQIEALHAAIASIEGRITDVLTPFRSIVERLTTIPGVGQLIAEVIVAEVGVDMTAFPTVGHFVSWAGLCPRNDQSAGKHRSVAIKEGDPWLKTALVQAGWGAARTKDTYLRAQFVRLKSRRGPKKAVVAVAASILTAAYFVIRDGVDYRELGGDYFDRLDKQRSIEKHVRRLEQLGYHVTLADKSAGAA